MVTGVASFISRCVLHLRQYACIIASLGAPRELLCCLPTLVVALGQCLNHYAVCPTCQAHSDCMFVRSRFDNDRNTLAGVCSWPPLIPCSPAYLAVRMNATEGSHSGLVRPPAKRVRAVTSFVGSNPTPSATHTSLALLRRLAATRAIPAPSSLASIPAPPYSSA